MRGTEDVGSDLSRPGEAMLARRSIRTFAHEAVPPDTLRMVLGEGGAMVSRRQAAGAASLPVKLWLAVNVAGDGLPAGVYEVEPGRPARLRLRRAGCTREDTIECLLQKSLGAAPAAIFVTGDFAEATQRRGARGYRDLLLHAGAAAGRMLIAATAVGLASCPSGGLMEEGFRALAGTDGYRDCVLFAVVVGPHVR
jgi:SagB-type dehydrogenase family enzyme